MGRLGSPGFAIGSRSRLGTLEQEITNGKAYDRDETNEAQLDAVIAAVKVELGAPSVLIHNPVGMSQVKAYCSDSAKLR